MEGLGGDLSRLEGGVGLGGDSRNDGKVWLENVTIDEGCPNSVDIVALGEVIEEDLGRSGERGLTGVQEQQNQLQQQQGCPSSMLTWNSM